MPKINRTDLENFFDYGLHIPSREIYLGASQQDSEGLETGELMISRLIKSLSVLSKSEGPITIITHNLGGCEYAMFGIYDAIRACKKNHIEMRVFGAAMSAGAVILQAADYRVISPNSRLMIHYGTWFFEGHSKDFDKYADENKILCHKMEDVLLERIRQKHPKFTRAKIVEMLKFDTFISASEAVDLGLADAVLPEE